MYSSVRTETEPLVDFLAQDGLPLVTSPRGQPVAAPVTMLSTHFVVKPYHVTVAQPRRGPVAHPQVGHRACREWPQGVPASSLRPRRCAITVLAGAGGSGPIGAWLDLSALVTSGAAKAPGVNDFAEAVGKDVFIDVAGWHLYLKDCKMAVGVASALASKVASIGELKEEDVRAVCRAVPVKLGAGRTTLSLLDVMPERCVQDLTDIARRFARKEL